MPDDHDDAQAHIPVLLDAVREYIAPAPDRCVLDCTLGLGGHAEALLAAGARVLGVDRDDEARGRASARLASYGDRFTLRAGTFGAVAAAAHAAGETFDGILADLGVSSLQLDDYARGFSIRSEEPLDLRMGDGCKESALELIDRLEVDQLADLLWRYGDERRSRPVARAFKQLRADGGERCVDFAAAVRRVVSGQHKRHPALRAFQALRIAVNDELGQVETLLDQLPDLLRPDGRVVIVTFHSLEDRLVKRRFRDIWQAGGFRAIARKPVVADTAEQARNRRAAPAKLRWAQR